MDHMLTFAPLDVDEHRDFLFAAHRETSRLTFGTEFTDEQIEREIEKERGVSTGAFLDGKIVGICDLETREIGGAEAGWVHFFYLTPELRGRGFGAQLVRYAGEYCRKNGLDKLYLRVGAPNTDAYWFYERCGFVRAPELDRVGADSVKPRRPIVEEDGSHTSSSLLFSADQSVGPMSGMRTGDAGEYGFVKSINQE